MNVHVPNYGASNSATQPVPEALGRVVGVPKVRAAFAGLTLYPPPTTFLPIGQEASTENTPYVTFPTGATAQSFQLTDHSKGNAPPN